MAEKCPFGFASFGENQNNRKDNETPELWDHLAGTTSAPFEAGEHGQTAVKVIDDRGNELMVVKDLKEGT